MNWPSYEISSLCNTTMKCKYCNLVYVFVVVTIQKNDKIAILSLQVQFWYLCILISHFTNTLWVKCTFTKLPINILKGRIKWKKFWLSWDLNPGPLHLKTTALPLSYEILHIFFGKKLLNTPIIFAKNSGPSNQLGEKALGWGIRAYLIL